MPTYQLYITPADKVKTLNTGSSTPTLGGTIDLSVFPNLTGFTMPDLSSVSFKTGTSSANRMVLTNSANVGIDLVTGSAANSTVLTTIDGIGSITKQGSGLLILNGGNGFTGPITVSAGTLQIGSAGFLGNGNHSGAISITGIFSFLSSANQTFSGIISGSGNFVAGGTGTIILLGANTYTGTTSINSGILQIGGEGTISSTGALGLGVCTIASGAQLVYKRADLFTAGNSFAGSGSIIMRGTGTMSMPTSSPFAGTVAAYAGAIALLDASFDGASGYTIGEAASTTDAKLSLTLSRTNLATPAGIETLPLSVSSGTGARILELTEGTSPARSLFGSITMGGTNTVFQVINRASTSTRGVRLCNPASGTGVGGFGNLIILNQSAGFTEIRKPLYFQGIFSNAGTGTGYTTLNTGSNILKAPLLGVVQDSATSQLIIATAIDSASSAKYLGYYEVRNGSLRLQNAAAISVNNELRVGASGTVSIENAGITVSRINDYGASGGTITASGTAATLTIGGSASGAFSGVITDGASAPISLVKAGTSSQTLTGANTYSGSTSITGGVLVSVKSIGLVVATATFTPTTLTVSFANPPTAGQTFKFFPGSTVQTYGTLTLVNAAGRTATYNSATSTLTIA